MSPYSTCMSFKIGERWVLNTPNYYPNSEALVDVATVNTFLFRVKACSEALLRMTGSPHANELGENDYSVILGIFTVS